MRVEAAQHKPAAVKEHQQRKRARCRAACRCGCAAARRVRRWSARGPGDLGGRRHQRDARLVLRARHIDRQRMRRGHAGALVEQRLDLRIDRHCLSRAQATAPRSPGRAATGPAGSGRAPVPGPCRAARNRLPSNTRTPLTKTPCTPIGSRSVRGPPPGRSLTRRAGEIADRRRIEQQQIGAGADRDAAAVGDAVEPGLVAGQPAHAFRQVEGAALAHPMAEEIEPEPGIAQIDQMRAGIGQRDDPGLVLDQRLDPLVDGVEEAADQTRCRGLPRARDRASRRAGRARARARCRRSCGRRARHSSALTGAATMTRCQLPWNTVPGFGLRRSARKRSRKLGSRNTAFSCSRS